jgi:hypothetical protein
LRNFKNKKRRKEKKKEGNERVRKKNRREKKERQRRKEKEEQILCVAPVSAKTLSANVFSSNGLVYGQAFMF